jgi:hypothetical protein
MSTVLSVCPNPLIIKEFFSFIREIFYYNENMDIIDYNLAVDCLDMFNKVLRNIP